MNAVDKDLTLSIFIEENPTTIPHVRLFTHLLSEKVGFNVKKPKMDKIEIALVEWVLTKPGIVFLPQTELYHKFWGYYKGGRFNYKKVLVGRNKKENEVLHHISDFFVVAFPKIVHVKYSGFKKEKHRSLCLEWIKDNDKALYKEIEEIPKRRRYQESENERRSEVI